MGTSRLYAGDSSGTMWAISPTNFTGTKSLWSYAAGSAIVDHSYDSDTDTLQFGTAGGKLVVLKAATGTVLNAAYPYTLDTSDPITAAPLYYMGVLVVGTTKGKVYFIDRNTGTGASIIKTVSFGSTQSVSTIAFDPITSRVMVSTSSAANDGRIYYFDFISDPTPSAS
jgi:outer membrane protein assembly factor BamB